MPGTEIPTNLGPVFSRWETPGGRINISGMAGELLANASTKTFNITGPTGHNITGALNQTIIIPTGTNYFEIGLNNGISLGSFQSTTPPTGGMLIPNQVSIGTGAPGTTALLEVSISANQYPWTVLTTGIKTLLQTPLENMINYFDNTTLNPGSNSSRLACFESETVFSPGVGSTCDVGASFVSSPSLLGNAGTLNFFYGYLANHFTSFSGTVINAYGGYFQLPGGGTNQTALAADDICCGVVPTGIPITGTFRSAPQVASTAFTYNTSDPPLQHTLGYDALYAGNMGVNTASDAVCYLGVASTSSGAISAMMPITGTVAFPDHPYIAISAYVPNNYWISMTVTGAGNLGVVTGTVTPV